MWGKDSALCQQPFLSPEGVIAQLCDWCDSSYFMYSISHYHILLLVKIHYIYKLYGWVSTYYNLFLNMNVFEIGDSTDNTCKRRDWSSELHSFYMEAGNRGAEGLLLFPGRLDIFGWAYLNICTAKKILTIEALLGSTDFPVNTTMTWICLLPCSHWGGCLVTPNGVIVSYPPGSARTVIPRSVIFISVYQGGKNCS